MKCIGYNGSEGICVCVSFNKGVGLERSIRIQKYLHYGLGLKIVDLQAPKRQNKSRGTNSSPKALYVFKNVLYVYVLMIFVCNTGRVSPLLRLFSCV